MSDLFIFSVPWFSLLSNGDGKVYIIALLWVLLSGITQIQFVLLFKMSNIMVKDESLRVSLLKYKSWLCSFLVPWPRISHITSFCINSLIYKMGRLIVTYHRVVIRIKQVNTYEMFWIIPCKSLVVVNLIIIISINVSICQFVSV